MNVNKELDDIFAYMNLIINFVNKYQYMREFINKQYIN